MSEESKTGVGSRTLRPDAAAKVTGRAPYLADLKAPGMLYAAIKAAPVASARLEALDVSRARALPGVRAVLTGAEIGAANRVGLIFDDQPLLVTDRVRMAGDRLALVAAETPAACEGALDAITAELAPLPGVYDVERALSPEAPRVHEGGNLIKEFAVDRGDLEAARQGAEVTVEQTYRIGGQEHAYLETQGCLVVPEPTGGVTVHASCQCPFYIRAAVSKALGLEVGRVRVVQTPTGGGFGGKEDYPNEVAVCAALLARHTGRPVQLQLPRELDVQASTKRHRMVVHHRLYANQAGVVQGVDVEILVDAGAYAGLSTVVAERSNTSVVGPYAVDNVRVRTRVCYTNNLFGGPFRGFGAPQATVAHEIQMDRLAREVGLGPLEVRRLNALSDARPRFSSGELIERPARLTEVLDRVEAITAGTDVHTVVEAGERYRQGTGVALFIYGCNLHHGGQPLDRGGALVQLQSDGSVNVAIGVTEMGQGALAAARAIAAEALGAPETRIQVTEVDTALVPDSGPTVASRATLVAGNAICDAAAQLQLRLRPLAAELLDVDPTRLRLTADGYADPDGRRIPFADVAARLYQQRINPGALGWYRSEERDYDPNTGQGQAYMFYSFGAHVTRVRVDTWTGKVDVLKVHAVHDVGRAIHPPSLEGQVQGGVVQATGWATMEDLVLREGRLQNASLTDYLIPTAADAPEIAMSFIEDPEPLGPFGARGIGEPSFIPGGAAIASAVGNALGEPVSELPLTPERVLARLTRGPREQGP
jgi:CO/xanthine dehydrogenase Mo-binding subunit